MYKVAGIVFDAVDCGETFRLRSPKYEVTEGKPEFRITLPDDEIEESLKNTPGASEEVIKYLLSGTKFYFELIKREGMLLHSSAVVKDGRAFLFTANPGVGKSTHTGYWLECFPDAYILNDDKPAIRLENGVFYAYGTPWSGKHDISRNEGVPIGGIASLERADHNFIEPMPTAAALAKLLSQTVRHVRAERMNELLATLDRLINEVPIFRLGCLNDPSAALLSESAMNKKAEE